MPTMHADIILCHHLLPFYLLDVVPFSVALFSSIDKTQYMLCSLSLLGRVPHLCDSFDCDCDTGVLREWISMIDLLFQYHSNTNGSHQKYISIVSFTFMYVQLIVLTVNHLKCNKWEN